MAQDAPVYAGMSIADHFKLGAHLNPRWDMDLARERVAHLGLDQKQKAGKLSGGQRAQLALTMALAKQPSLLILDEPAAALDPLARREFMTDLAKAAAERSLSVLLSSHLIEDLERACDYLIVLANGRVQVAGRVPDLLATHQPASVPGDGTRLPVPRPRQRRDGGGPMIWLTWRQFRVQALALLIPLAALAVALIWTEPGLAHLYAANGLNRCAVPGDCGQRTTAFLTAVQSSKYPLGYFVGGAVLYLFPAVIGAFWARR